ncbi:MAG: hypothetical protein HQK77_22100, partial [Desulfobacterales bacterium]|nr:hypothetical protein [Desulfobacterales bacterium]
LYDEQQRRIYEEQQRASSSSSSSSCSWKKDFCWDPKKSVWGNGYTQECSVMCGNGKKVYVNYVSAIFLPYVIDTKGYDSFEEAARAGCCK